MPTDTQLLKSTIIRTLTIPPLLLLMTLTTVATTSKQTTEEILHTSKLKQKPIDLTITRDLFSPDIIPPKNPNQNQQPLPMPAENESPSEEVEKPPVDPKVELENEIRRSVFYEGYIIKHPRNFALVSTNGEFFAVGDGDILLERIKIIKIDSKAITVEVDSISFQIQLKGDDSNE